MNLKQAGSGADVDERLAALLTNANAVRAITAAVEGTIGPKGLDTMLVDRFGEVIITNDGVTILDKMDVNHPAAKMLINTAKAQQAEVGDGTTTTTIMAGSLVAEGVNQVMRGVPVARVIEGIKYGVARVLEGVKERARSITEVDDPILRSIAMIAGREHEDIADLVVEAAKLIGVEKLTEHNFKLSDIITAEAGADNEVFLGVIVDQERMTQEMPEEVRNARLLLIDDALEPEEIEDEALSTEAGFKRYIELQDEFKTNVQKIVDLGINVVMVDRGVHSAAEELLTDANVMVIERVSAKDLRRVADHTGARMIKRTGLKKEPVDIEKYLGAAEKVYQDEKLEQVRVIGGNGKPMATILVGAATEEVVGERERIAKDAASSVQAAVKGGYVPGGGSIEIAMARKVNKYRENLKGMAAYGLDCVANALKQPLSQIVENAGFNPLEKVEDAVTAQAAQNCDSLGVDCDTGEVTDMLTRGVIDPVPVKLHAIKAAGEVAVAILRIDTIIKKKEEGANAQKAGGADNGMPDF
ncbi:TCP-1/cpn60 chaperonin family protein [Sporomusa aerivorans]|uniref:TCP-1/cpn60 chaperonin family protein n=1 Tax=Sporomusa aerivorans TaxID=204936 RepID=UPI00352B0A9E